MKTEKNKQIMFSAGTDTMTVSIESNKHDNGKTFFKYATSEQHEDEDIDFIEFYLAWSHLKRKYPEWYDLEPYMIYVDIKPLVIKDFKIIAKNGDKFRWMTTPETNEGHEMWLRDKMRVCEPKIIKKTIVIPAEGRYQKYAAALMKAINFTEVDRVAATDPDSEPILMITYEGDELDYSEDYYIELPSGNRKRYFTLKYIEGSPQYENIEEFKKATSCVGPPKFTVEKIQ